MLHPVAAKFPAQQGGPWFCIAHHQLLVLPVQEPDACLHVPVQEPGCQPIACPARCIARRELGWEPCDCHPDSRLANHDGGRGPAYSKAAEAASVHDSLQARAAAMYEYSGPADILPPSLRDLDVDAGAAAQAYVRDRDNRSGVGVGMRGTCRCCLAPAGVGALPRAAGGCLAASVAAGPTTTRNMAASSGCPLPGRTHLPKRARTPV